MKVTSSAKEKAVKIAATPANKTAKEADGPATSKDVPAKTNMAEPIIVPTLMVIAEYNPRVLSNFLFHF